MYRTTAANLRYELGTSPLYAVALDVALVIGGVVAYAIGIPLWLSAPLLILGVLGVMVKLVQWGLQ